MHLFLLTLCIVGLLSSLSPPLHECGSQDSTVSSSFVFFLDMLQNPRVTASRFGIEVVSADETGGVLEGFPLDRVFTITSHGGPFSAQLHVKPNLFSPIEEVSAPLSTYLAAALISSDIHSPDILVLGGNCRAVEEVNLFHASIKFLVFVIDPLIPPLIESGCSLAAVLRLVGRFYTFANIDPDGTAVFVLSGILPGRLMSTTEMWMRSVYPSLPTRVEEWKYMSFPGTDGSGRMHCYENVCDCLPPFRGEECALPQMGSSVSSNTAIYYVTSNETLTLLHESLLNLHATVPNISTVPILVFYDSPIDIASKTAIGIAGRGNVWFISQFFHEGHPRPPDPTWFHYRPLGYRQVCRFESGPVFWHSATRGFSTLVRLDTDGYFPSATILFLPPGASLGYSGLIEVAGNRLSGFSDFLKKYFPSANLKHPFVSINNPPYVFDRNFFDSPSYRAFFRHLDSVDGFYRHGWLGNAVLTAGVELLGGGLAKLPYLSWAHRNHCECYNRTCVWVAERWTCER